MTTSTTSTASGPGQDGSTSTSADGATTPPSGSNDGGTTSKTDGAVAQGGGTLNGVEIFDSASAWNEDISNAEVDPNSATYIANMAPTTGLHADFSNIVDGDYGIPYIVVDSSSQPLTTITFTQYGSQSDPGPYPIPLTAPIETGSDHHVIAVDTATHMLYELFTANVSGSTWDAACGAKFDLTKGDLQRPDGWTSADAAGLPIFPGLTRTDEVIDAGVIKHALRFTMQNSQAGYVAPAQHFASNNTSASLPPMGLRVRLKASVDISAAGPQAKVMLQAMKTYGLILADNGSNWYVSGTPDARWDDDDMHTLGKITGSDFEVVKHGTIGTSSP